MGAVHRIADEVWKTVDIGLGERERKRGRKRKSALQGSNSVERPSSDHQVRRPRCMAQEMTAAAKWQFVLVADYEAAVDPKCDRWSFSGLCRMQNLENLGCPDA